LGKQGRKEKAPAEKGKSTGSPSEKGSETRYCKEVKGAKKPPANQKKEGKKKRKGRGDGKKVKRLEDCRDTKG